MDRSGRPNVGSPAFLIAIATTLIAAGCAKEGGCRVAGTVTFDGKALANGLVMFLPDPSDPQLRTVSALITDGRFQVDPDDRLLPGKYRLAFTSDQATGKKIEADPGTGVLIAEFAQVIPRKYNAETTLEVQITADQDDLKFDLKRR